MAEDILNLWQEASLVCLGETHGSVLDAGLRQALVEHPRFAEVVDVVVLEFVNPLHGDLLHRLMKEGESLTRGQLRPLWRDAGLGRMWELAMYEDFLRTLARRNAELPAGEKIAVVGAAVPVDWGAIESPDDLNALPDRQEHYAAVLEREVLNLRRAGLAIFGAGHCERLPGTALGRVRQRYPGRVRSVFGFENNHLPAEEREGWGLDTRPRLIPVRGQPLALEPAGHRFGEIHFYGRHTIGQLLDAIVDYGDRQETLLDPWEVELPPGLEEELERRARFWQGSQRRQRSQRVEEPAESGEP